VRVRTDEGFDLHVETAGDGPSMMLCNGLFCSTHYYEPWIATFRDRYRVVSFDYRGHGRSDDPPDADLVGVDELVDDAATVLAAATSGPTILVGHSMGVRVVAELARRFPDRVRAVILLCGSGWTVLGKTETSPTLERAAAGALSLLGRVPGVFRRVRDRVATPDVLIAAGSLFGGLSRETPRGPVEELLKNVRRLDPRLMTSLSRSYLLHSAREALAGLTVPVLQIVGDRDMLAPPAHAEEIGGFLREGTTHVMRGCTHLAPIERPDELHAVVDRFLLQLPSDSRESPAGGT
jgi:pimeloyl-ACP methyl ester carboxylesterase